MKLSQKLSEIKQKEGELLRLINQRQEIIAKRMGDKEYIFKNKSPKEIESITKKFIEEKKKKFNVINDKINNAKKELIDMKCEINRKNVEFNVDKKLLEVKWLRIELSKLMKSCKEEGLMFRETGLEEAEELGLTDYITLLEKQKNKVDSSIQQVNLANEL